MASSDGSSAGYSSPISATYANRSHSIQRWENTVSGDEVVQGRVFWLPPQEELPDVKAVRRAHGRGAVDEGIYNHPIVVVSRPAEDPSIVHFQLITSFQGKKLHEIYGKANEFHSSRRSWFLPISPSPEHPDANSKKAKKRFPTLKLASGAVLRWDSYINLRHVYKIDWRHLRPYCNPDTPWCTHFSFERESMIRLLAKGRILTNYATGSQYRGYEPRPSLELPHKNPVEEDNTPLLNPEPYIVTFTSDDRLGRSPTPPSDFRDSAEEEDGGISRPPKAPPDGTESTGHIFEIAKYILRYLAAWWWSFVKRIWHRLRILSSIDPE